MNEEMEKDLKGFDGQLATVWIWMGDKSQENKMGKKDSDKIFPSTTLKWIKFNTEHVGFFVFFFTPQK